MSRLDPRWFAQEGLSTIKSVRRYRPPACNFSCCAWTCLRPKRGLTKRWGCWKQTLGQVRDLSQQLCPSPAYRGGLKQALLRLADQSDARARLSASSVQYTSTL